MNITAMIVVVIMILASPQAMSAPVIYDEKALVSLFTTTSERNKIDMQRQSRSTNGKNDVVQRHPSKVVVNGVIRSSRGKSTVWINGKTASASKTVDGVKILPQRGNGDKVTILVDGMLVRIKPGERWSQKRSQK